MASFLASSAILLFVVLCAKNNLGYGTIESYSIQITIVGPAGFSEELPDGTNLHLLRFTPKITRGRLTLLDDQPLHWTRRHGSRTGTSPRNADMACRSPRVGPEMCVRKMQNGWMGQLQERAKPIIERLWLGAEYSIDLNERRTLVSWAVMTSIVMQNLDEPDNWVYSECDRTVFWKCQHTPSFMGIWVANCVGHASMYTQGRSMHTGPPDGSARPARAHAITMAFGTLGIQVLKVTLDHAVKPPKDITVSQGFGNRENIALQIWPLKGDPVDWPPPKGIRSESELEVFAARFRSQGDSGAIRDVMIPAESECG